MDAFEPDTTARPALSQPERNGALARSALRAHDVT